LAQVIAGGLFTSTLVNLIMPPTPAAHAAEKGHPAATFDKKLLCRPVDSPCPICKRKASPITKFASEKNNLD
jgi:hypothetical protein